MIQKEYAVGIYLRISQDDSNTAESSSIKSQRNIIHDYAERNGLYIKQEYVDDGYSGTNFDRPAMKRMQMDFDRGYINCIIVKDHSRLGRNSGMVNDLVDNTFAEKGIRYISVTEGYDTHADNGSGQGMSMAIISTFNEIQSRQTSEKIKSAVYSKWEKGEYTSSFAVYGYQKSPANKNKLIPDEQVSHNVQRIFQMADDGVKPLEIARQFNLEHIPTPAMHRCNMHPYLNLDDYSQRKEWTSSNICKMLRNETYTGVTVCGKTQKVSFKSKKIINKPSEEWLRVEETHEPLISKEQFRRVRNRSVSRRNAPTKDLHNIFAGLVKCADCGQNMSFCNSRKKGETYNLVCNRYKSYGKEECSNHYIAYSVFYNLVLEELHRWLTLSDAQKSKILRNLEKEEASTAKKEQKTPQGKRQKDRERRKHELETTMGKLFEEYSLGKVAQPTYDVLFTGYQNELQAVKAELDSIQQQIDERKQKSQGVKDFFALLEDTTDITELDAVVLNRLIDHIEVEQGFYIKVDGIRRKSQRVRIYYRFMGCIDAEEKGY